MAQEDPKLPQRRSLLTVMLMTAVVWGICAGGPLWCMGVGALPLRDPADPETGWQRRARIHRTIHAGCLALGVLGSVAAHLIPRRWWGVLICGLVGGMIGFSGGALSIGQPDPNGIGFMFAGIDALVGVILGLWVTRGQPAD